ncbi:MAG: ATP-binding protein [Anaerolineales bacterium]|jgi:two-component system NtrC family sensor kinase
MTDSNKILLVLPEEKLLNAIAKNILRDHAIEKAKTTAAARKALHEFEPNVILVAERMENGGGLKFVIEVLTTNPSQQVILLSEGKSRLNQRQALVLGLADWLTLPLKPDVVRKSVKQALDRHGRWKNWRLKDQRLATGPLEQRVDELETIFRVGRAITAQLDLDQVLSEVLSAAVTITGAEEGSILLPDEESGELYMVAARNFQEEFVRTFRLPVEDTHAGQVYQSGEPFFLHEKDPQKIKTAYLVFSLAYVPLIYHGRTIGVLGVDNRRKKSGIDQENMVLLNAVADYAAIAIENAKLYAQTEEERGKLSTILTQIEDGVLVVSESGEILLLNHVVRKAFDLGDADFTGQQFDQVFSANALLAALRGESPNPDRIEIQTGEDIYYRLSVTPIEGIGRAISMHDITYLKKLNQVKTEFVNTVTHDLRSPLTSILGYVDLMRRVGDVNDKQLEFIERVKDSVSHITSLIDEVLNLGRVETQLDANFRKVSLASVVQELVVGFRPILAEKELTLKVDVADSLSPVFGDAVQLRQVFENLVGNAIKYTNPGGCISVTVEDEVEQIIIRVQDDGVGIPLAAQAKIFDRFYRAPNVAAHIPGTGLGLSITKSIVENHRGRIWVDSKEGEGSIFSLVLPVYEG